MYTELLFELAAEYFHEEISDKSRSFISKNWTPNDNAENGTISITVEMTDQTHTHFVIGEQVLLQWSRNRSINNKED